MDVNDIYRINMRRMSLLLAVSAVVILVVIITDFRSDSTRHTDCEIARIWYEINSNPAYSFEDYLEDRFRSFGVIEPSGFFSDPQYSVAIRYPEIDKARIKSYRFLVSRDASFSSQMSISISLEEWSRGRKIICDSTNVDRK